MDRKEYRSILGRLPIKSPSAEDMATLCPHLQPGEAVEALTSGSGYVACPPLRVDSAFQIISYSREHIGQDWEHGKVVRTKNCPATLNYSFAGRIEGSTSYKYTARAIDFAKKNWGSELTTDNWVNASQIYVQDPSDLVNDRYHHEYPRTKAVLYLALDQRWNNLNRSQEKPQSVLIDDAIVEMTLDQHIWYELKGGRGSYTEFNCAYCGSGLHLAFCPGCGHRFTDDHMRTGWDTPLSPKMVAYLRENGHHFAIDPQVAWERERIAHKQR